MPDVPTMISDAILDIPLKDLCLDDINVRHDHVADTQLIASLAAVGLLQPLLVQELDPVGWRVVDGGRRLVSILKGVEDGTLPVEDWQTIQCRRVSSDELKEISLHANLHLAMHPLDACEAIRELARTEESVERIAQHFGQTVLWVNQRAKLGGLSEKARRKFREGHMGMDAAMLMTRLSEKQQDKLCRAKDVHVMMVREEINAKAIDANAAIFDWETDYPSDKIQRSLFDDITLLTDLGLFDRLQEKAIGERIEAYKKAGYDEVIDLRKVENGWRIRDRYIAFDGKVTPEMRAKLCVLVEGTTRRIIFHENMINAKAAKKLMKGKDGATATTKEVATLTAADLSQAQKAIVSATWAREMVEGIRDGRADDIFLQYLVVAKMLVRNEEWTGHSANAVDTLLRWVSFDKANPGCLGSFDPEQCPMQDDGLTYAQFRKLNKADRLDLYHWAVAMMIEPIGMRGASPEFYADSPLPAKQWLRSLPKLFFQKYRGDQLIDFVRRCGSQHTVGASKEDKVNTAFDTMGNAKKPYLFGFEEKVERKPRRQPVVEQLTDEQVVDAIAVTEEEADELSE